PVRVQYLPQEHRKCHRGRKSALTMLGKLLFYGIQKLGAGQQIEELVGLHFLHLFHKTMLLLLGTTGKVTSHEGWPRARLDGCVVTNILPILSQPSSLFFNPLARARSSCRCANSGSRQNSVFTWLQEKKLGCTIWLESPHSMKRSGVL